MAIIRKYRLLIFVTLLLSFVLGTGAVVMVGAGDNTGVHESPDINYGSEETVQKFLDIDEESGENGEGKFESADNSRLTQRLTVRRDDIVLPYSGTVTKDKDGFYPGTYVIRFGERTLLSENVNIEVKMEVAKGDKVYILTGDIDSGYYSYDIVTAKEDNTVEFRTAILQTYTLSTTDIIGAQEAVAYMSGD